MLDLDHLPLPHAADQRIAIRVKPAAERALRQGHPWLFADAIRQQSHAGQPGDLAVVFDAKRRFLAIGLYDPDSPIRVKILQHHTPATIDRAWFADQLHAAAAIRAPLSLPLALRERANHRFVGDEDQPPTTGYRLVHGENDRFPGLIIDRYADTLVLKLYTAAWLPHLRDIVAALPDVQPFARLILRLSRSMAPAAARANLADGDTLIGDPPTGPITFSENGLRFAADVVQGHKTGFFFDQRDNRVQVRDRAADRRVLDVFAYSGGFSVYAAAGGALTVTSVDVSAPALAAAAANFALNRDTLPATTRHITLAEDAFTCLERLHAERKTFDIVIVDPPAFAKRAAEIDGAIAAYTRLTRLALAVLEPGGVFVMASCSSRVTPAQFVDTVTRTAAAAGRPLHDIMQTGHALDHPIRFPEGEYLKCLFAQA